MANDAKHPSSKQAPDTSTLSSSSSRQTFSPLILRQNHKTSSGSLRHLPHHERLELEALLVRKIDLRLLPMVILMYILNYLDRNNIAAARLAGLESDLSLTGTQYLTALSILFVGYILMQIPSNLFLNKVGKPAIYLPGVMVVWGIISAATAGVKSYGELVAVRFLLGFVEAAYFPGCLFFLSSWYTRKELGFRTAIMFSGSLLSGAFSGLISAGITHGLDGARGLRAWRWLFIIEGAITVAVALGAFWVLPNFPTTTGWLTEEERELAVWRLEEDVGEEDFKTGTGQEGFWLGIKLASADPKTYILMLILFSTVSSSTVTNLFPTLVSTLGYPPTPSLLLTAPPYILAVLVTFANAWHADRQGERYWHVTLPLYVAIVSFIVSTTTGKVGARYAAMMFMVPGVYASYVVGLAWVSNTLPRPAAKRAAALALINAVSNSSSIYASYMYPKSASPRFVIAMSVNCVTALIAIIAATLLRIVLGLLNKKLDRGEPVEGAINSVSVSVTAVTGEATEKGFRFIL